MGRRKHTYQNNDGFTIVELLIVVVVIAILAAITIIGYNGIQQSAKLTAIKSELSSAGKSMELVKVQTGTYPTTLPANIPQSSSSFLSLSQSSNGFCVNAQDKTTQAIQWRYDSAEGGLREGLCSGQVIAGSEQGMNPNLVTSTNFASGWTINFQNAAGRTITTRDGASGDPFPTRPVLVLQNSGTTATSWALVQSSHLNRAEILNGQTYIRNFWVRKIGPFNGGMRVFGLMDGNLSNLTFSNGSNITPENGWRFVSEEATAVKDATSGNVLYLSTDVSAYATPGWSLEFQGFEIRRV